MYQTSTDITTPVTPTSNDIRHIWQTDQCVNDRSAIVYMQRIKLFRAYCDECGLEEREQLTLKRVSRFITWYAHRQNLDPHSLGTFRSALRSLGRVYHIMGLSPPAWNVPEDKKIPRSLLFADYADYLFRCRGNPGVTIDKKLYHIGKIEDYLTQAGKSWQSVGLTDIDAFLIDCAGRYARSTVSDIACSLRCFSRFLHSSGRISVCLAEGIIAPIQPRFERPRRALPWDDVQRLLKAADISSACGKRDYAILLLMSTYGLGAGEIIRLQFHDIDWNADTVKFVRPKTGVVFTLPLIPAVAKSLALYLRNGRPADTSTRNVFVQMKMPFAPLAASSAIRHIIIKHAQIAGIKATYLGSHVLRHSNAARQIDLGIRPCVLSDLLGHSDPESLSAYVRIATQSLRDISLPVPV